MRYELTKPTKGRSLFDLFFGDKFYDDFFSPSWVNSTDIANWSPAVDVVEKDDRYIIKADLPGIDEKDINVELKDGILTLRGERKNEYSEEKDNVYRCERTYGSFLRSFNVADVNEEDIKAKYKNGMLTIELPKAKEKRSRKIEIKKH